MAEVSIKLNRSAVRSLLKSPEMEAIVSEHAGTIAGRCGRGYETDTRQMGTRVIASVFTADRDAIENNLNNNTLLKALQ